MSVLFALAAAPAEAETPPNPTAGRTDRYKRSAAAVVLVGPQFTQTSSKLALSAIHVHF